MRSAWEGRAGGVDCMDKGQGWEGWISMVNMGEKVENRARRRWRAQG